MAHSPFSFKNRHLLGTSVLGSCCSELSALFTSVFLALQPGKMYPRPSSPCSHLRAEETELREGARAVP